MSSALFIPVSLITVVGQSEALGLARVVEPALGSIRAPIDPGGRILVPDGLDWRCVATGRDEGIRFASEECVSLLHCYPDSWSHAWRLFMLVIVPAIGWWNLPFGLLLLLESHGVA